MYLYLIVDLSVLQEKSLLSRKDIYYFWHKTIYTDNNQ